MKHLLTLACFLGALASYALWFQTGASILIAAGILLELTFWIRSSRARRESRQLPRAPA
jgi:ABC-type Mn2+/Zn2+ transport system permease subunit